MMKIFFLSIFISFGILGFSQQWGGPDRNGIFPEKNLLKEWPQDGPKLLWKAEEIGDGYSSVSVTGKLIYVTGKNDTADYLTAFDKSGNKKWQVIYGKTWDQSFPDSRCTPTIISGKVYVLSGMGEISCIDAENGNLIWKVDAFKMMEGKYGMWGVCESLLVFDDKVIYTPAGDKTTMIALNKETGKIIWQSETLNDVTGYVSPILIEYGGKKIIVSVLATNFIGVEANNGKIIWKYNYSTLENDENNNINTNSPIYYDGQIFITNGYNHCGAMFKLSEDATSISLLWTTHVLDVHHGGAVLVNGYIYGSNWLNNGYGKWCCLDWNTGQLQYEKDWICKGSIVAADNMLYCFEERSGNLALVKPDPFQFNIVSSFKVPFGNGPYWAHPVINDGVLYVRHGKVLMAYNIRNS